MGDFNARKIKKKNSKILKTAKKRLLLRVQIVGSPLDDKRKLAMVKGDSSHNLVIRVVQLDLYFQVRLFHPSRMILSKTMRNPNLLFFSCERDSAHDLAIFILMSQLTDL